MINTDNLSPMMKHYLSVKEQYPDCFVFYRLGDFYEMFFDDAIEGSKIMELTLTGRDCGLPERAPMCGVPYHSVDTYVQRMIDHGKKVAICEQMEDPALAKGLVERSVIRVITPGTVIEDKLLDSGKNNFILSVFYAADGSAGLAYSDISTGEFNAADLKKDEACSFLIDQLSLLTPSECICNNAFSNKCEVASRFKAESYLEQLPDSIFRFRRAESLLTDHYHVASLDGFGFAHMNNAICAAGALLQYLYDTQKNSLKHLQAPKPIKRGAFMSLDCATRKNLELTENIRGMERNKYTLISLLDKTVTAPGKRMLRSFIDRPLCDKDSILFRQNAVSELYKTLFFRNDLRSNLDGMYDIERLTSKIAYRTVMPRDCVALLRTLKKLPNLISILNPAKSAAIVAICSKIDPLSDLCLYLDKAIVADPPATLKDGGFIREGFNDRVDELRNIKEHSQSWLDSILEREQKNTGIKNLRIGYNRVFGYYLEVTKSFAALVPDYYERKQTLTGAERYITPELKEVEQKLLTSGDELIKLESSLYDEIRDNLFRYISSLQIDAECIAELDVYQSLSFVAAENGYCCPEIEDDGIINIKDGRHPIVEKSIANAFISNDVYLDMSDSRLLIITGPNMAGKSTYMRQTALIVLMACLGSFVPASSAHICIVDRIFTRIGASDDLSSGQSTFMVEMNEVANILNNATKRSLLILDEIGRGTSTYDGLSIAWAVLERIASEEYCGAKTLFATHYHELSELEGHLQGVKNYRVLVKEYGDEVLFLRKIARGSADKSFGVQVAKLAGIPDSVIKRAKEILATLETNDSANKLKPDSQIETSSNNDTADKVISEILSTKMDQLTPLDALNLLAKYQTMLSVQ